MPWERWGRTFTDAELGPMQFGRLVGMRLTEVEVHHADLAFGFGPRKWSPALTRTCLPLRVASLTRLRNSPAADHSVNGSWILQCDDLDRRWNVVADQERVWIDEIAPTHHDKMMADVVLRGTALDLTAVLLGRQDPVMLAVSGNAARRRVQACVPRAVTGPARLRRGATQNELGFANTSRTSGSKCSSGSVSYVGVECDLVPLVGEALRERERPGDSRYCSRASGRHRSGW